MLWLPARFAEQLSWAPQRSCISRRVSIGSTRLRSAMARSREVASTASTSVGRPRPIGCNHLILHRNTSWVHLALGAFVKAAIEFTCGDEEFRATGHGVLSGEHYVYRANPGSYYQAVAPDSHTLSMWGHTNIQHGQPQRFLCHGPTTASPPSRSISFDYGGEEQAASSKRLCRIRIWDYKQVGGFFRGTAVCLCAPHSVMSNMFLHVNDAAVEVAHSDASTVTNLVVWKCDYGPVIHIRQEAAVAREDTRGAHIQKVGVIHSRYRSPTSSWNAAPSAVIGITTQAAAQAQLPDLAQTLKCVIQRLVVEGPWTGAPALLCANPVMNIVLQIEDLDFPDGFVVGPLGDSVITRANYHGMRSYQLRQHCRSHGLNAEGGTDELIQRLNAVVRVNVCIQNWRVKGVAVTMDNFLDGRVKGDSSVESTPESRGEWHIT